MISGIIYFSTKFVHNKEIKDLGTDHEALYIDFKYRKNLHLNYPTLFNFIFLLQRLLMIVLIVLQPLHKANTLIIIQIFMISVLVYACFMLHYKPLVNKLQARMLVFNQCCILVMGVGEVVTCLTTSQFPVLG